MSYSLPVPKEPILIVDDTPYNLKVLSQSLREIGWKVAMAPSGEAALRQARCLTPALILLDIMMPDMDGFETCQKFKADPTMMHIPIIFMTALSDTVDKVKGLSLGAVDYITKPFQPEEVLARVSLHYQLRSLTQQLETHNECLEQRVEKQTAKLQQSLRDLKETQLQLVQREKMATLGQLTAGIAHEINNPIGFIDGNLGTAREYIRDLLHILHRYQKEFPEVSPDFQEELDTLEVDFITTDLPKLIDSMQTGADRIRDISVSFRTFSRADNSTRILFNIHNGIDSTLSILKHRLNANKHRPAIQVLKKYSHLPDVQCYPGSLNQVFMNLIANAIDALEENNQGRSYEDIKASPNCITVQTFQKDNCVVVRVRDNGIGMTEQVSARIFEQSFTTKAVGKGTGLGLAIAQQIVEEKHGGTLTCTSQWGQGTEFSLALPLQTASPESSLSQ